jgi:hypothetical protein
MGLSALLPLRRKSCCGSLSPSKIHRPRPGFNTRTVCPMENTITITTPRTTNVIMKTPKTIYSNKMIIIFMTTHHSSVRNGNLEVHVYFLKAKKDIPSEKLKKINGYSLVYTLISSCMTFRQKNKFRYGITAHTGQFWAQHHSQKHSDLASRL